MAQAAGRDSDVALTITKRIPVGAGLGGGSADAAATILAVNQLWELHWPMERLRTIAATLGADMPFCLSGGFAHGTGFGERIEVIDAGSAAERNLIGQGYAGEVLVGAYQSQLSTPEVYHTFDAVGPGNDDRNHLQAAAISLHPRSGQAIDAAVNAGAVMHSSPVPDRRWWLSYRTAPQRSALSTPGATAVWSTALSRPVHLHTPLSESASNANVATSHMIMKEV